MNVISIGTDAKMLDAESQVSRRAARYAEAVARQGTYTAIVAVPGLAEDYIEQRGALRIIAPKSNAPLAVGRKIAALSACARKAIQIGKELSSREIVITAQDPFEVGVCSAYAAHTLRAPLHVQIHTDPWSPYFESVSCLNKMRTIIMPNILRRASRMRVVSERLKASLVRTGYDADRIDVLPISVAGATISSVAATSSRAGNDGWRVCLVLSRLESEKNVEAALRAFIDVARVIPDIALHIAGSGSLELRLKGIAHASGLGSRIEFLGWISEPASLLRTAHAYVSASYFEGFGMSIVEAALAGVSLVTTDVGVIGYGIARDHVYVADSPSKEDIASALRSALSDPVDTARRAVLAKEDANALSLREDTYVDDIVESWRKTATNKNASM